MLYGKCRQRTHFLRILKNIKVNNTVLTLFYKSAVQPMLIFCVTCWYGNSSKSDKQKLNKIVNTAKRMNIPTTSVFDLYVTCVKRLILINKTLNDNTHPIECSLQNVTLREKAKYAYYENKQAQKIPTNTVLGYKIRWTS